MPAQFMAWQARSQRNSRPAASQSPTAAKPVIWQQWDDFAEKAKKLETEIEKLSTTSPELFAQTRLRHSGLVVDSFSISVSSFFAFSAKSSHCCQMTGFAAVGDWMLPGGNSAAILPAIP